MKKRQGVSLILVLLLSLAAALILAVTFLFFTWSQDFTAASRRQFLDRAALSSLVWTGHHWLEANVPAGEGGALPAPQDFAELRLHRQTTADGNVLDIYALNYDPVEVQRTQWFDRGPDGFFPPCPGGFLIRAFRRRSDKTGRMLEAVFLQREDQEPGGRLALEDRPFLWREVWF